MDIINRWIIKLKTIPAPYLVLFFFLIYLPITLNIFFVYHRTIQTVEKEKLQTIELLGENTWETINSNFQELDEAIESFRKQPNIRKGLEDIDSLETKYQIRLLDFMSRKVEGLKKDYPLLQEVVCITSGNRVFATNENLYISTEKFFQSEIYEKLLKSKDNRLWIDSSYDQHFGIQIGEARPMIIQSIRGLTTEEIVGYLFVFLRDDLVYSLYSQSSLDKAVEISLYGGNNTPIFHTPELIIPADLLYSSPNNLPQEITIGEEHYIFTKLPLTVSEGQLVSLVPKKYLVLPIKKALSNSFWLIFLINSFSALWTTAMTILLSKTITEREMARYRLSLSEEMNEKLRIHKHDFNNHLQIVQGLLELDHSEKAIEYLRKIVNEGKSIHHKYTVGIPEIEAALFAALSTAENNFINVEIKAVELQHPLPFDLYDMVKILTNLLKNAIEALESIKEGEKKLTVVIKEELGEVIFQVSNNQPLISKEMEKSIFSKGFTTKKKGSGLGLSIITRLVEKNGGCLSLTVNEQGNHFTVSFPKAIAYNE